MNAFPRHCQGTACDMPLAVGLSQSPPPSHKHVSGSQKAHSYRRAATHSVLEPAALWCVLLFEEKSRA